MTSRICLVALLVCMAALLVAADPARKNEHRRGRYAALRRHHSLHGARSHQAPAYAAPEEQAELVEEQPQEDAEPQDDAEVVEGQDDELARLQGGGADRPSGSGGATAIANAVSKGNNAKSDSRATAYHGKFSGGQFSH